MNFGEFFLKDPATFPAKTAGAPWGREGVSIALAGLLFHLSGLSQRQAVFVRQRYMDFLAGEATAPTPPLTMEVYRANPEGFHPLPKRGWTYTLDMDYQPTYVRIAGLHLMATIGWSPDGPSRLWSATEDEPDFALVFGNVFRILLAYALLRRGGVLLHSAGVSDGQVAWIGFGHSGAGKSTLSGLSLAAGKQVLSDDINVLRFEAGRWCAQRLPFAGELGPRYGEKGWHPVAGLCRLLKGAEHRLEPLDRPRGVAALVASAPYVNQDPYRVLDLMATLDTLLAAVPCYSLTFRPDAEFWRLLQETHRD